jgi:hypothetical protein
MALSFTKVGENEVDGKVESVQDGRLVNAAGNPVGKLRVELKWEQPQLADRIEGGRVAKAVGRMFTGARQGASKTDVDANAVIFDTDKADVDFAGPDHLSATYSLVKHRGNVISGSADTPEIIDIDLAGLHTNARTQDIMAVAITASCFTGDFTKVTGATVEFYDDTNGSNEFLSVVRFAITGNAGQGVNALPNNAALVVVIVRNADGWTLRKGVKTYGRARDWRGLAPICRDSIDAL